MESILLVRTARRLSFSLFFILLLLYLSPAERVKFLSFALQHKNYAYSFGICGDAITEMALVISEASIYQF